MKHILLKATALLLLLFLADRGLSWVLSDVIFPRVVSGEAGGNLNYLLHEKRDAELLVLGSSRAQHQINPAQLYALNAPRGFNAGIDGVGTILHNSVILDLVLREGHPLKYVILQTDARHFYAGEIAGENIAENAARSLSPLYPFIEKSPLLDRYIREDLRFRERVKLTLHAYRFNGKMLNLLLNFVRRNSVGEHNGFSPLGGIVDTNSMVAASYPGIPSQDYPLPLDPLNLKAFRNLSTLCKNHNIRLIVVFPPYWQGHEKGEDRQDLMTRLHGYGADRVLDFGEIDSYPPLNQARFWRDPSHLNGEGAALFSQMLNDSLRQSP